MAKGAVFNPLKLLVYSNASEAYTCSDIWKTLITKTNLEKYLTENRCSYWCNYPLNIIRVYVLTYGKTLITKTNLEKYLTENRCSYWCNYPLNIIRVLLNLISYVPSCQINMSIPDKNRLKGNQGPVV